MDIQKTKNELKGRIAKGLNFGLSAVEEMLDPSSKSYNDFILIKSKYNDLMHISSVSTVAYDQLEIGLNKLRAGLLRLIDDIEERNLKSAEMDPNLKKDDFPNRRTNFFKLLEIHFQNLSAIHYKEILNSSTDDSKENIYEGRMAFYPMFDTLKYHFKNQHPNEKGLLKENVQDFFQYHFTHDRGRFEVYFKNIKHMLSYIFDSDIEVTFFLNILKSLFSRYEIFFIFYYTISGMDEGFKSLIEKSGLIDSTVQELLFHPEHYNFLATTKK